MTLFGSLTAPGLLPWVGDVLVITLHKQKFITMQILPSQSLRQDFFLVFWLPGLTTAGLLSKVLNSYGVNAIYIYIFTRKKRAHKVIYSQNRQGSNMIGTVDTSWWR